VIGRHGDRPSRADSNKTLQSRIVETKKEKWPARLLFSDFVNRRSWKPD